MNFRLQSLTYVPTKGVSCIPPSLLGPLVVVPTRTSSVSLRKWSALLVVWTPVVRRNGRGRHM